MLGCIALVGLSAALLVSRAALALLPGAELSGSIALYLGFAAVLLGGFLLLYYVALRFDNGLARGLASIAVTLPAFFVIVAVFGMVLSWISTLAGSIGRPAEAAVADGFSWVYDVQRVLGSATDYFVRQDAVIIGGSVVFAAVLLLLYAYTVPYYWMSSVAQPSCSRARGWWTCSAGRRRAKAGSSRTSSIPTLWATRPGRWPTTAPTTWWRS